MIALVTLLALTSPPAAGPFFEPVRPPRPVQVMVHRGLADAAPENTRRALEMAGEDYLEWVEVDIRLTADGQHVLFHDDRLDARTDGRGPLEDRTLAELKRLDAGSWFARRYAGEPILTLAEALELARGRFNLYLDAKRIDPERLAAEVAAAGLQGQVVLYADLATLARARAASGGTLPLMAKWRPGLGEPLAFAEAHGLAAVEVDPSDLSPEAVAAFRACGRKVQARTLGPDDAPEVWDRAIAAGVDWIQTDRPLEVLTRSFRARHPDRPVRFALHRGASRYAPENTIPALELADRLGADFIEVDIRVGRDGRPFLLHDATLERTTSGRGPVSGRTAEELSALDAGAWFGRPFAGTPPPALDAGLAALGPRAHAYLDAKAIPPEDLARAIRQLGLLDRSAVYQSVDYLRRLKAIEPAARAMPPLRRLADLEAVAAIGPYAVDVPWTALTPELIGACHARGILVFSDALGLHERVDEYLRAIDRGVDLIQTDHPARLLRALELHAMGHRPAQ